MSRSIRRLSVAELAKVRAEFARSMADWDAGRGLTRLTADEAAEMLSSGYMSVLPPLQCHYGAGHPFEEPVEVVYEITHARSRREGDTRKPQTRWVCAEHGEAFARRHMLDVPEA